MPLVSASAAVTRLERTPGQPGYAHLSAFRWNNLFVRVDVLLKQGKHVKLIEVKSKSVDTTKDDPFRGKRGGIDRRRTSRS